MAVYQPDHGFLTAQLRSIAAQSHRQTDLVCVIADRKSADITTKLAREQGLSPQILTPSEVLEAPRAFEFGLGQALQIFPKSEFFALSDQDDIWRADRLASSLSHLLICDVDLVHSDARLIDGHDRVIAPSLFDFERRSRSDHLAHLLYANTATGMTLTLRRDCVERALPFPPQDGVHFYHDLWLALVAAAGRGVARLNQPLVYYRQHGANTVGAVDRAPRVRLRHRIAAFSLARYLAMSLRARGLGDDRLRRYWKPLRAWEFIWDAMGLLVQGQMRPAVQAASFAGVVWARLGWSVLQAAKGLGPAGLRAHAKILDAKLYSLSPGVAPTVPAQTEDPVAGPKTATPWWTFFDARTQPKWTTTLSADRPVVNVFVPTLNPSEMFAGIATAVDLGLELAQRGEHVRFIATDLPIAAPQASRAFVLGRANDISCGARFTLACGVTEGELAFHPADQFLATAWWTAHLAHKVMQEHRFTEQRFWYLIQDYEPHFYPWGTEHAGALASYDLPMRPIFNSQPLCDYTLSCGHWFGAAPLVFAPSINTTTYANLPRPGREKARIVFYGRPEVPRNLFPLGVEALGQFVQNAGLTANEVEVVSLGLPHQNVLLPNGVTIRSLGKLPWADYPGFLAQSDLGLSLMMSPHPSHPPIEMAAAGMRVVTNRFSSKDLSTLAPHIVSAPLTAADLAGGLETAWRMPAPSEAERAFSIAPLGAPLDAVASAMLNKRNRANPQTTPAQHPCAA